MRIPHVRFFVGLPLAVGLLAPLAAAAQAAEQGAAQDAIQNSILSPVPRLADLGSLDDGWSTVYAVNDRGQAVGASTSAHGERAVLW